MSKQSLTPEQFLSLNAKAMHAHVGYTPYVGGGGPMDEQVKACIDQLHAACLLAGFIAESILHVFGDDDYAMPAVKVGETHAVVITYDRWGYCDGYSDLVDQAPLYDTIIALHSHFESAVGQTKPVPALKQCYTIDMDEAQLKYIIAALKCIQVMQGAPAEPQDNDSDYMEKFGVARLLPMLQDVLNSGDFRVVHGLAS